jgi:transcription initiation factor TFIIIB Brf1 subunit/transcription initiation factor TFIIB
VHPLEVTLATAEKMPQRRQEWKPFHNNQKLKQCMATKPPLQKILQGILYTEDESKQNHKRTGSTKPQEKKRQIIRQ